METGIGLLAVLDVTLVDRIIEDGVKLATQEFASGEMSPSEFTIFLIKAIKQMVATG